MGMTDPIADFLTRIRNANSAKHKQVSIPASNIKREMTEILKEEGFIRDWKFEENEHQGVITITLKYGPNGEHVITGLKRISKPGLRTYAGATEVPRVLNGLGIALISTSQGVVTDKTARDRNIGGEVLAYVW